MVDKPAGVTSHDVVAQARRLFSTRSIGHTGTLDPFATGLLVLVIGRATRLARFVEASRKAYLAEARLGIATSTDDVSGDPIGQEWTAAWPSRDAVEAALGQLVGRRDQRPPAYSAKRRGGERSYARARRGEAVTLDPVPVEIHELELVAWSPPLAGFRAVVGPGTYVRAIARDLGERLGTGAHLTALRRTRVGSFRVEEAHRLDRLTGREQLLTPRELLGDLPAVSLMPDEAVSVRHGRSVPGNGPAEGMAALLDGGRLLAVAERRQERWQPVVVLHGD
ncbi:MAG: tRNA pseudouridine(55) synthase TruB [Gemmatimonadales bacterium]